MQSECISGLCRSLSLSAGKQQLGTAFHFVFKKTTTVKMEKVVIFVFFCAAAVIAFPTTDCGSKHGSFSNVTLSCTGTNECILKRNTNVTMNIQFTPSVDVKTVTSVVHGIIEGLPVPFPIPNPNACEDSGLKCPLSKGGSYDYYATFFVKKSYPKVHVNVRWEMKDEGDVDIVCILIPARIL